MALRTRIIGLVLLTIIAFATWELAFVIFSSNTLLQEARTDGTFNCSGKSECHLRQKRIPSKVKSRRGLTFDSTGFYLDGRPFRILSGSFDYFRTQPHQWIDRLERVKAAGLNTVCTSIPWNLHERNRGKYDFMKRWKLFAFIKLIKKMSLLLIVQPGPFVGSSWEFGGLPAWILHDRNTTADQQSKKQRLPQEDMERYFNHLLPLLAKHAYKNGGPIVAVQIVDELGDHHIDESRFDLVEYLRFLSNIHTRHSFADIYFTTNDRMSFQQGSLQSVKQTTIDLNINSVSQQNELEETLLNKPLMFVELRSGRYDSFGEEHHTTSIEKFCETIDRILSTSTSVNFHSFVGGTNFVFMNGATFDIGPQNILSYSPTTTSHDYDAPVSENGDCHPKKYQAVRTSLLKYKLVKSGRLPPIPSNPLKMAYGKVKMTGSMGMDDFVRLLAMKPVVKKWPMFMELLDIHNNQGQGYGWILYRTSFDFGNSVEIRGIVNNRAHVFINGKLLRVIYNREMRAVNESILLRTKQLRNSNNTLEILVENMGRHDGRSSEPFCGFQGTVTAGGKFLSPWEHVSLDFQAKFVKNVKQSKLWKPFVAQRYPKLYRGRFHVTNHQDTFLNMQRWTKGIVFINGYNVGRYWTIGPQQTLYIPKSLLRSDSNDVMIFELENPANEVEFVDRAILNRVVRDNSTKMDLD